MKIRETISEVKNLTRYAKVNENHLEIQLKGMKYGLRIIMPESISEELLLEKILNIPSHVYLMPIGEGMVLDFQSRTCSTGLILKILEQVIWPMDLRVLAWLSSSEESILRFKGAGLKTEEPITYVAPIAANIANRYPAIILYNSLRSGQKIESDGDVVLWGHLNVGAEIFASGSVIVMGRLKGLIHAGMDARDDVYVIAGSFEPQQVRVADKLCYTEASAEWWQRPVLITLQNGQLIIRETTSLMRSL